jgi:hypothetical protein
MTDSDWIAWDDPARTLVHLQRIGTVNDRRLTLFGVACCERIWCLLLEDRAKLLVVEKMEDGWSPSLSATLREFRTNRAYIGQLLVNFANADVTGTMGLPAMFAPAIALARIAWAGAQSLADCVALLEEERLSTEALRSCAIDFEMEGSSDVAPRDIVLYAAAGVLFAASGAWSDLAKAVAEGQARYAAAAAWKIVSPAHDTRAVAQAGRAAGTAERHAQCDHLRHLFSPGSVQ